jgi:hypothetical protein
VIGKQILHLRHPLASSFFSPTASVLNGNKSPMTKNAVKFVDDEIIWHRDCLVQCLAYRLESWSIGVWVAVGAEISLSQSAWISCGTRPTPRSCSPEGSNYTSSAPFCVYCVVLVRPPGFHCMMSYKPRSGPARFDMRFLSIVIWKPTIHVCCTCRYFSSYVNCQEP